MCLGRESIILKINGRNLDFDVETYLKSRKIQYDIIGNNAMFCCPFHKDHDPSFGINIYKGVYRCFSGSCGAKGNIVNFVQKIENLASYEDSERWLIMRYGIDSDELGNPLELVFGDEVPNEVIKYITDQELRKYDYRHPYLGGRGIEDIWQSRFRIGFDRNNGAVTLPWFDRLGRCVSVKKRSVFNKFFWWDNPSETGPNKITLFGSNHVFRRKARIVVIVESEIDAIYCWQCGFAAVALGTSSITDAQLTELKNTYVEAVIIATDNDDAGRKIADNLARKFTWITDLRWVDWSKYPSVKDVNELPVKQLIDLINSARWDLFSKCS